MKTPKSERRSLARVLALASLAALPVAARADDPRACAAAASTACYFSLGVGDGAGTAPNRLHYYASLPTAAPGPRRALVALHGHSRDANKIFDAALQAVRNAGAVDDTLVIAPVFQVGEPRAGKCSTAGVPAAASDDLLWTCSSWLEGAAALNDGRTTSFAALDALLREVVRKWPDVRTITVAGFSAGAQMIQHSIGFAEVRKAGDATVRYVVADPGTWLYFDPVRARPEQNGQPVDWSACGVGSERPSECTLTLRPLAAGCDEANRWKYGTDGLPASLGRSAADARAAYVAADVGYLEGALDRDATRGTAYRVLDKSCAAMAQGPYRLQRGLAYVAYDRALLSPDRPRRLAVVPDCAHDVACVFPSAVAREILLGPDSAGAEPSVKR